MTYTLVQKYLRYLCSNIITRIKVVQNIEFTPRVQTSTKYNIYLYHYVCFLEKYTEWFTTVCLMAVSVVYTLYCFIFVIRNNYAFIGLPSYLYCCKQSNSCRRHSNRLCQSNTWKPEPACAVCCVAALLYTDQTDRQWLSI